MKKNDFEPVTPPPEKLPAGYWGYETSLHTDTFPVWTEADLVIVGVSEDPEHRAANAIRAALHHLPIPAPQLLIADLGNLKPDNTRTGTYERISVVTGELVAAGKAVLLIGGAHDLMLGQHRAYVSKKRINVVNVDEHIDLQRPGKAPEQHFLEQLLHNTTPLFSYSHLAFQQHYVPDITLSTLEEMYFDLYRLGELRADIRLAEPVLRDADLVALDMASVCYSDAPAQPEPSPNGLDREAACRIARYAGISDNVSTFGLYGMDAGKAGTEQTAMLAAQMIWYFSRGMTQRVADDPRTGTREFIRYTVVPESDHHEVTFWKSKRSGRWWMEVPIPESSGEPLFLSCSYDDYLSAGNGDLPDRWMKAYRKLS